MLKKNFNSDFVNKVNETPRGLAGETKQEVKVDNTTMLNKQTLFVLKSGKGASAQNLLVTTNIEQAFIAMELNKKEFPFVEIQVFYGCGSNYDTLMGYLRTDISSDVDILNPSEVYILMDSTNHNVYMTSSLKNLLVNKFAKERATGSEYHFDIFVEGRRWDKTFGEYIEERNNRIEMQKKLSEYENKQ